jgi:hypothetical protein
VDDHSTPILGAAIMIRRLAILSQIREINTPIATNLIIDPKEDKTFHPAKKSG